MASSSIINLCTLPSGCHGHSEPFLAGFPSSPLGVEQLHTQTALLNTAKKKKEKKKLLQFLIYYSLENLGSRVENVFCCMDDDIKSML